jgi:hypothetical protein
MHDRKVPFDNLARETALLFTKFLTKNTRVLLEAGFQPQLLRNMHRCLKQIFRQHGHLVRFVQNAYATNSVILYRLKQLMKASELPEF